MLVVMQSHATDEQVRAVCERIESLGFKALPVPGAGRTAVCITGNPGAVDLGVAGIHARSGRVHPGQQALQARQPRRQSGKHRGARPHASGRRRFWRSEVAMVAGPCAIETREQAFTVAKHVKAPERACSAAARTSRALPRTAFKAWAKRAWKSWREVRKEFGLGIITEAIDNESLDLVEEYADVIQIGARNMQNFSLLKRAGRAKKPVLLKRGMSATLDEFLMAAEYLMSEGNYAVILCERGVRTFSDFTRNTLDLSVVPAVTETQPSSHRGGSFARHRASQQSIAALSRRGGRRRRRAAGGSPPRPGPRPFRRSAVHPARRSSNS